jgi:glycosyltransferase involved in cell wall biosynthesis
VLSEYNILEEETHIVPGDSTSRLMIMASGDLWAGAEAMVYQLCRGLREIGEIDILVVLLNEGKLAKELKRAGFEVCIVDEAESSQVKIIQKVYRIVRGFSPHIIHSHRYKENFVAWVVAKYSRNIGLVATQHGMPETIGTKLGVIEKLRPFCFFRLMSSGFDHSVFVSWEMKRSLVGSYGFREDQVSVVHNGIHIPPGREKSTKKEVLIGSAGRLFPVKDYLFLVEIARVAVNQNDSLRFLLAGDGPDWNKISLKVKNMGLEKYFKLLGNQEDMDSFFSSLDIYINTSIHEGIPMSVLEAMARWLPVIAPDVGGLSEIVEDGTTGYLVANRDPGEFAERVLALLDVDVRESFAFASRKRAEKFFSREAMAQKYWQVYTEVNTERGMIPG